MSSAGYRGISKKCRAHGDVGPRDKTGMNDDLTVVSGLTIGLDVGDKQTVARVLSASGLGFATIRIATTPSAVAGSARSARRLRAAGKLPGSKLATHEEPRSSGLRQECFVHSCGSRFCDSRASRELAIDSLRVGESKPSMDVKETTPRVRLQLCIAGSSAWSRSPDNSMTHRA